MATRDDNTSVLELALGAASLFLFLIGIKRSFRRDDGVVIFRDQKLAHAGDTASSSTSRNIS